jgi:L-iditol 2-dehydrogenase
MKTAALSAIRSIKMMDIPEPEIKGDPDVKIAVASIGICGSDVHYYTTGRIGSQIVKYPFTVGHECSGIVEAVGAGVSKVKPGDRIAVEPAMPCHECDQCLSGRPHTCRKQKFLGCPGIADGCLSEYLVMPQECCLLLPENVTLDGGAFSEPFAIGVYAVKMSVPVKGARIAILGCGPIGLSVLFAAKSQGAETVYMTDRLDYRVDFAKNNGATWAANPDKVNVLSQVLKTEPFGVDVVFECCGKQEAVDLGIEMLKPGGKLVIVGIPEFDRFTMRAEQIRRKEIVIQNIRRQNGCPEKAIEIISNGYVPIKDICTHSFPLDKTGEAFDLVAGYRDGVIKAMINIV